MGMFGWWPKKPPADTPALHPNVPPKRTFSTPMPIDQMFRALYSETGAVSRADALSVPAVSRGRNLVCSIATLPLQQVGPDNAPVPSPLLAQLDPDVTNVVTLAQTIEDLLLVGIAWWEITATGWDQFPASIRRIDPANVTVTPPSNPSPSPLPGGTDPRNAVVYVDGRPVPATSLIRFDSPNPAILTVGARAIRRAIALDQAAKMYADDPRPLDYFTPNPDAEELDDPGVANFLAQWQAYRKQRSTAWVPAEAEYHSVATPSPSELQLVELQRQAGLEIANLFGVDPEDLGISTTSRTYQNNIDRRRDRVNDVLAPYMRAVTDRLSMGDVTRRGYTCRFDLNDYLKSNPTERWSVYQTAHDLGVLSDAEIRQLEGIPGPPPKKDPPRPGVGASEPESTVDPEESA